MFDNLGFDVLTASNAGAALDILRRDRRVDVLFSDAIMPGGMNGIELSREAGMLRPDIKVLLASGYPLPALQKANGELDHAAFISKPYRWSEVVERLRTLDVTRGQDQAVHQPQLVAGALGSAAAIEPASAFDFHVLDDMQRGLRLTA